MTPQAGVKKKNSLKHLSLDNCSFLEKRSRFWFLYPKAWKLRTFQSLIPWTFNLGKYGVGLTILNFEENWEELHCLSWLLDHLSCYHRLRCGWFYRKSFAPSLIDEKTYCFDPPHSARIFWISVSDESFGLWVHHGEVILLTEELPEMSPKGLNQIVPSNARHWPRLHWYSDAFDHR